MRSKFQNCINWLLPVFLILFIAEVIAFPVAIGITYAGRSENPDHTLTYKPGSLTWSNVKGIDAHGTAELSVFDAEYQNVLSENGESVVAPGTEGLNIIRLSNEALEDVTFTAVVYSIKTDENLPVRVSLADGDFSDTEDYSLPENVDKSKVIRSVRGSVRKNGIVDFDISWLWDYYVSDSRDMIDVDFGNRSANGSPDEITVGFYLVIEHGGEIIAPQTGDNSHINLYLMLMAISGAMIVILFVTGKRGEKKA